MLSTILRTIGYMPRKERRKTAPLPYKAVGTGEAETFLGRSVRLIVGCSFLVACHKNDPWNHPRTPSQAERTLFDNGVDLIPDATGIGDSWQTNWFRDLQMRVHDAQVVARVKVGGVSFAQQRGTVTATRLQTRIVDVYWGQVPGRELTLVSRRGDWGFRGLHRRSHLVLGRQWLLTGIWVAGRSKHDKKKRRTRGELRWSMVSLSKRVRKLADEVISDRRNAIAQSDRLHWSQ